jgi:hypothetical protein
VAHGGLTGLRVAIALAAGAIGVTATRDAGAYRPFDGTDAAVAEVGEFELEYGPAQLSGEGKNYYFIARAPC